MEEPFILGLDVSSSHIGYVLYHAAVLDHGEWQLSGDIAERCRLAYSRFYSLLDRYPQIDCVAIEGPASRYKKSLIPQCRVSGAILALAGQRGIPHLDVSPTAAKYALAGIGNASKQVMQLFARSYGVEGEHAADALAVALVACKQVEVLA